MGQLQKQNQRSVLVLRRPVHRVALVLAHPKLPTRPPNPKKNLNRPSRSASPNHHIPANLPYSDQPRKPAASPDSLRTPAPVSPLEMPLQQPDRPGQQNQWPPLVLRNRHRLLLPKKRPKNTIPSTMRS